MQNKDITFADNLHQRILCIKCEIKQYFYDLKFLMLSCSPYNFGSEINYLVNSVRTTRCIDSNQLLVWAHVRRTKYVLQASKVTTMG